MIRSILFAFAFTLVFATSIRAHDPILIDATVSLDDGVVAVTVEMRQAALLAGIGEVSSQFHGMTDFQRLEPRIADWLVHGVGLTVKSGSLSLSYAGRADQAPSLGDPISLRLSGRLPAGVRRLSITLTLFNDREGTWSVIDNVHLADRDDQTATVKPGEAVNFLLDPSTMGESRTGGFVSFVRLGFLHIVPEGVDHVLFVLGLFLLSPRLKPILTQVTAFTVAHSLTLGLVLAGIVTLPARVVEPLIAGSIAVVAIENVMTRELRSWRWMIVFAFGLVHGLGFAGALKDLHLPTAGIWKPLIGFNLGVELGQLTVIGGAAALTWWSWNRPWYRRRIVVPVSLAIAAVGAFWAVQRALGFGISP
ncbi:MAG: HupE/UreJ family protein [Planctomycetes bacterium]|nr:HupE/UreJ family protein [Planctomycetota bacterium]